MNNFSFDRPRLNNIQQQQFLQSIKNHRTINELLHKQNDNSNKQYIHYIRSSNEELFGDIERSRIANQTNSSGESKERSKTGEKHHRALDKAINMFDAPNRVLILEQDQDKLEGDMMTEIHKVFSKESLKSFQSTPNNKLQNYGSILSTEISNEPEKTPSKLSLLSGSNYYNNTQIQEYPYQDDEVSFYENNQRRKRKTISDQDSYLYVIRPEKIFSDPRTTIMIKNIPNKYTTQLLNNLIDENFREAYDFLYLPIDFKNRCNMGYAFINFVSNKYILDFYKEFQEHKWPHFNSEKISQLRYARIQGRQALVQHFQYSSVMNQKDKKLKPVILPCNDRIQHLIKNQKKN